MIGNGNVLVEVNAAVRKLAELSSLLDLCSAKVQSASAIMLCVYPCIPGPCRSPPMCNSSIIIVYSIVMRALLSHSFFCPGAMGRGGFDSA